MWKSMLAAAVTAVWMWGLGGPAQVQAQSPDPRLEGHQYVGNPFEARKRYNEVLERLRQEQQAARRRPPVPTFIIPQPAYPGYYYYPRCRPYRWRPGRHWVPGGRWIFWGGQLVWVPF